MKVIIAEKPSVAREIARVVRATNRKEGYIEGSNYTVTWALGHLITVPMPEAYGFNGFHRENLPILPPVFTLIPRQVKSGKGYTRQTRVPLPSSKSLKNSSKRQRASS